MPAPFFDENEAVPAPPRCAWAPEHTNKVLPPVPDSHAEWTGCAGYLRPGSRDSHASCCMKRSAGLLLEICAKMSATQWILLQVRLIGLVGGRGPEVRRVGDQTIAQVSLGIRPKTGNTNELSWVVCDFWNHEVHSKHLPDLLPCMTVVCFLG